jgi:hypothetical protein
LDSRSLAAWNIANIEILIQAPTDSAGSVIRLLTSIANADYSGVTPPSLIIELPSETDPMLLAWLNDFVWPPDRGTAATSSNGDSRITIRHRIPIRTQSPEEASIRFFESFFPQKPRDSHVFVLAPTTQLSPLYYQSLRYHLLRYKYSVTSSSTYPPLLGIALDLPRLHLNGSSAFVPPDMDALDSPILQLSKPESRHARPPFLWEAPDSNAVLYFGEQWRELHSFLSLRLARMEADGGASAKKRPKLIAAHMPSWTEYVLEFMRARGYSLLFPGSSVPHEAMATVHQELDHGPEEFERQNSLRKREEVVTPPTQGPAQGEEQVTQRDSTASSDGETSEIPIFAEPFLPPEDHPAPPPTSDRPFTQSFQPLHVLLPFSGPEPPLASLPHLAFDGTRLSDRQVLTRPVRGAELFRRSIGGCADVSTPKGKKRKVKYGSAEDLFCFGDEEWEDAVRGVNEGLGDMETVPAKRNDIDEGKNEKMTVTSDEGGIPAKKDVPAPTTETENDRPEKEI